MGSGLFTKSKNIICSQLKSQRDESLINNDRSGEETT